MDSLAGFTLRFPIPTLQLCGWLVVWDVWLSALCFGAYATLPNRFNCFLLAMVHISTCY